MEKIILTEEFTPNGTNILLNGELLYYINPSIIFRLGKTNYVPWDAYINDKEGSIYLITNLGYSSQVHFFNRNSLYKGEYILTNIVSVDVCIHALMEGEIVNDTRGCRSIYVGGWSDNGCGVGIRKLNPAYMPMVEDIFSPSYESKFEASKAMEEFFPILWEGSQQNLRKLK